MSLNCANTRKPSAWTMVELASDLFERWCRDGVFDVDLDTSKVYGNAVTTSQVIRLWEFKPECVD